MKNKLRLCEDDELDIKKEDIVDSEGEKVEEPKEELPAVDAPVAPVAEAPIEAAPEIPAVVEEPVVEEVPAAPAPVAPINIEIVTPGAVPVADIAAAPVDPVCPSCEDGICDCSAEIAASSISINTLIKGEWDALELYNSMLPLFVDKGLTDAVNTINDIIAEEYVHIGQLEGLLKSIDMNASSIAEGEAEHAGVPETMPAALAVGMVK